MNKLIGFGITIILLVLTFFGADRYFDSKIDHTPMSFMRTYLSDRKFGNSYLLRHLAGENTITVLGSSELNSDEDTPYYPFKCFRSEELNTLRIGRGGCQSLVHAGVIAAMGEKLEDKKVMLIISPQWFTKEGIQKEAAAAFITPDIFEEVLRNKKISDESKDIFAKRTLSLFVGSEKTKKTYDTLKSIYDSYQKKGIKDKILLTAENYKSQWHYKKNMLEELQKKDTSGYKAVETNPKLPKKETMLEEAGRRAKEKGSNNMFEVEDGYFNEYMKSELISLKNSQNDVDYSESAEYDDLLLFIKIAKEQNLNLKLISMPLHGKWSDYTGFSKEKRKTYYDNIRKLAKEENLELIDYSDHEYDPYFLKDIMHIGEKGWVYIDEEIQKFHNQ